MICKTMSTYTFRNMKGKREEGRNSKEIENNLLIAFNINEGKEYKQFIRIF